MNETKPMPGNLPQNAPNFLDKIRPKGGTAGKTLEEQLERAKVKFETLQHRAARKAEKKAKEDAAREKREKNGRGVYGIAACYARISALESRISNLEATLGVNGGVK